MPVIQYRIVFLLYFRHCLIWSTTLLWTSSSPSRLTKGWHELTIYMPEAAIIVFVSALNGLLCVADSKSAVVWRGTPDDILAIHITSSQNGYSWDESLCQIVLFVTTTRQVKLHNSDIYVYITSPVTLCYSWHSITVDFVPSTVVQSSPQTRIFPQNSGILYILFWVYNIPNRTHDLIESCFTIILSKTFL